MIGLDRPLRPRWIYEFLNRLKIGDIPKRYNSVFEDIATELTGKEGKRKVRTIIFRSFIYSFQEKRAKIEKNLLIDLSKRKDQKFMEPLYLVKILMDYEICRYIVPKINLLKSRNGEISNQLLTKRMVQEYGDRDIVKRSVRSFLSTLCHFNILRESKSKQFIENDKLRINDEQWRNIIRLYSICYLKSKYVDLNVLNYELFFFINMENGFKNVFRTYHGNDWEFIRDVSRNVLIIK